MSDFDFDLFTIGAGSGGVRASRVAATLGARVGVAESRSLGGTCVNLGCIPKKLFSYAAQFSEDEHASHGYGWSGAKCVFDWHSLLANKDREIARLNAVYERMLHEAGVSLYHGHARVVDRHTVEVNGHRFTAKNILVACGGHPVRPEIPGGELAIVSDDAFHLPEFPRRTLVVGGGYIAVEFASIFCGLGSQTTLVHRRVSLLKEFDAELGEFLAGEMGRHGVDLRLAHEVVRIEKTDSGLLCTFLNGASVTTDVALFATGRLPNTDGMGLERVGVEMTPAGAIVVNERFQTAVPSIYAVGDCIGRINLTPVALAEGMVVAQNLFGNGGRQLTYFNVPTAVFSHPNVATVGMSEDQAASAGFKTRVFKSVFTPLRHTLTGSDAKVFLKLVVDAASDRVLGAHMVSPDAGETIQGIAIAMECGATKAQFDATLGIHPTVAEEFVTMRQAVSRPSVLAPSAALALAAVAS